jgi:tRNA (guanine-N(7)-)-methyltransferase subunit TRM82
MPKRPCAIALTRDNSTIIYADKFGDVFSLPLLEDSYPLKKPSDTPRSSEPSPAPRRFVPSANESTVHTLRNQRALQNQLKSNNPVSEKTGPDFTHELLLGHVSMLTDLALIERDRTSLHDSGSVRYIITSDRDEHIRVTRGPPQSHIIHGYCLGHTEFVSKMCVPRSRPDLLVSGGGDDFLLLWDWKSGASLHSFDLKQSIADAWRDQPRAERVPGRIAVSGIWDLSGNVSMDDESNFLVACEG